MPALLFFAPCEKVIIDQQNNTASLISILEEIKIQIIAGMPVQPNSVIAMQWSVLSLWEQQTAWDRGRAFEQRTALISPSGAHLMEVTGEFTFDKERQRMINRIVGMPVSESGLHKVTIWIREKAAAPKEWKEAASYPLVIEFLPPPTSTAVN